MAAYFNYLHLGAEGAYHYSTASTLHPLIRMISQCWHGAPSTSSSSKNNRTFVPVIMDTSVLSSHLQSPVGDRNIEVRFHCNQQHDITGSMLSS